MTDRSPVGLRVVADDGNNREAEAVVVPDIAGVSVAVSVSPRERQFGKSLDQHSITFDWRRHANGSVHESEYTKSGLTEPLS